MSGRFPGARDVETFWSNLCGGVESISRLSDDDLRMAGVDPATASDPAYVKAGGVLEDIDMFDATFFGYSAREAESIDPQHRLFLECAWEALELSGTDPYGYPGAIGVFAGAEMSRYLLQ